MGDDKFFDEWIMIKRRLHFGASQRSFSEGEIWWCAVGENVGVEINGKSDTFARPILVLKKLSKFSFMGIPLTTKAHDGTWYVKFRFKDVDEYAVLSQARAISVSRLYKRMGEVSSSDLALVRRGFEVLYCH